MTHGFLWCGRVCYLNNQKRKRSNHLGNPGVAIGEFISTHSVQVNWCSNMVICESFNIGGIVNHSGNRHNFRLLPRRNIQTNSLDLIDSTGFWWEGRCESHETSCFFFNYFPSYDSNSENWFWYSSIKRNYIATILRTCHNRNKIFNKIISLKEMSFNMYARRVPSFLNISV